MKTDNREFWQRPVKYAIPQKNNMIELPILEQHEPRININLYMPMSYINCRCTIVYPPTKTERLLKWLTTTKNVIVKLLPALLSALSAGLTNAVKMAVGASNACASSPRNAAPTKNNKN